MVHCCRELEVANNLLLCLVFVVYVKLVRHTHSCHCQGKMIYFGAQLLPILDQSPMWLWASSSYFHNAQCRLSSAATACFCCAQVDRCVQVRDRKTSFQRLTQNMVCSAKGISFLNYIGEHSLYVALMLQQGTASALQWSTATVPLHLRV